MLELEEATSSPIVEISLTVSEFFEVELDQLF